MKKEEITITKNNLPLYCPKDNLSYECHPKVYLTFTKSKTTICPYCGTKYNLIN